MPRRSSDYHERTKGGSLVPMYVWVPVEVAKELKARARVTKAHRRDLVIEALRAGLAALAATGPSRSG